MMSIAKNIVQTGDLLIIIVIEGQVSTLIDHLEEVMIIEENLFSNKEDLMIDLITTGPIMIEIMIGLISIIMTVLYLLGTVLVHPKHVGTHHQIIWDR